jgi:polyphenol oxidase
MLDPWLGDANLPIVDLGGGFVMVDVDREARPFDGGKSSVLDGSGGSLSGARRLVIVATALADTGARGFASPFDVDARLDADAWAWAQSLHVDRDRRLVSLKQVHGATVLDASTLPDASMPEADGAWTQLPTDLLIVRTADCAAVWLVEPERGRLALLHVGWRGAAAGIIGNAIRTLVAQGCQPGAIVAAVGPHIGRCCFEVGLEVAARFYEIDGAVNPPELLKARTRSDTVSLDLGAIIAAQLREAGVSASAINIATACTRCNDSILHSYRRSGQGGPLTGSLGFLEQ